MKKTSMKSKWVLLLMLLGFLVSCNKNDKASDNQRVNIVGLSDVEKMLFSSAIDSLENNGWLDELCDICSCKSIQVSPYFGEISNKFVSSTLEDKLISLRIFTPHDSYEAVNKRFNKRQSPFLESLNTVIPNDDSFLKITFTGITSDFFMAHVWIDNPENASWLFIFQLNSRNKIEKIYESSRMT